MWLVGIAIILWLLTFSAVGQNLKNQQQTIRIAVSEWPPYTSLDLPHYGTNNHIITAAFALEGVTVQYGFFPWARAKALARSGEWDAVSAQYYTKERANHFLYSVPLINITDVFFHLKNLPFDWKTLDDLKSYKIGTTIGYSYGKPFDDAVVSGLLSVETVPKDVQNLRKLLGGRIEIVPMALVAGTAILRKHFTPKQIQKITYHPKPQNNANLYLVFSKQFARNEHMAKLFEKGMKKLKKNGTYQQIIKQLLKNHQLLKQVQDD